MSNHLAIATVTAALGRIVHAASEASGVGSVGLNFGRPTANGDGQTARKVHVYLYQVSPNASLCNSDMPTRSADGKLLERPQAALNLRYLIAFYGNQQTLEPDRMLGAAVRSLHAHPVLSRQSIQDAVTNHSELTNSNLADAVERVKFTPAVISLDELSKLWSVFFQTPHALSVVYDANVVLIESEETPQPSTPVLKRGDSDQGVDTLIGPFPFIESVYFGMPLDRILQRRPLSLPAAQLGLAVIVGGRNLGSETMLVRFHHSKLDLFQELPVSPADLSATELKVQLPQPGSGASQTDWAPGVYTLRTVQTQSGTSHERTSNGLPVAFSPIIGTIEPGTTIPRDAQGTATITITCQPRVRSGQRAVLLVGGREIVGRIDANNLDKIIFVVQNAPTVMNELIRLRVDGIESMPFKRIDVPPPTRFEFDPNHMVTIT